MLQEFISLFHSELAVVFWHSALESAPIWVPLLLILGWFDIYINFKQRKFISSQTKILLEIKIPREVSRSPQAMEMFINTLYNNSAGSLIKVYAEGSIRPWFSLEIVSLGGQVKFFVWTWEKFKSAAETQLYAQFPDIEVHEVPDYTKNIHHNPEKIKFGKFAQMGLTKADAYPIMTYIDYGLDKDPKEEFKHDPLVALLEYMGALKEGEQAWVQILIRAHTKEGIKLGRITTKPDWKKGIEKEIEDIRKKATPTPAGDEGFTKFAILSKGQQDIVSSMERNMGKFAFDTMIRVVYFAETEKFNPNNIGGLLGSFRQFSSNTLNGFKPIWGADYDYPWQDFRGQKRVRNEKRLLEAYKRRSFFDPPFKNFHGKPFILSTEELATLFHFPSQIVASTPTLTRLPSKKSEAPSNLPI